MSYSLFLPRHAIAARDEPEDIFAGRRYVQLCLLSEQLRTSVIDLYHTAAILSPSTSSLALDERLAVQNLLFHHCLIKVYCNEIDFYLLVS